MIRRGGLAAAMAMLAAGCVGTTWAEFQREQEAKYLGRPLDTMLPEWGPPISTVHPAEGNAVYEFQYFRTAYACHAKVETTPDKTVRSITVSGQNGCIDPPL
jgi:hypothetical protein